MPFDQGFPRPFTASSVREYAPAESGVYAVSNAREWIYIGAAGNVQEALLLHLQEPGTALLKHEPTGFVFEACDPATRSNRLDRLVREYDPPCNRHSSRRQRT